MLEEIKQAGKNALEKVLSKKWQVFSGTCEVGGRGDGEYHFKLYATGEKPSVSYCFNFMASYHPMQTLFMLMSINVMEKCTVPLSHIINLNIYISQEQYETARSMALAAEQKERAAKELENLNRNYELAMGFL